MTLIKGTVVKALAGREDGYFAVINECEGRVLIANGKQYKVENPKRKNIKHLMLTHTVLCEEKLTIDKKLKKALSVYAESRNPTGG